VVCWTTDGVMDVAREEIAGNGSWSVPVCNVVDAAAVRRFADAIGDPNPLWRDPQFAVSTRHKRMQAPPTFARTFDYGRLDGDWETVDGLIHGEQSFRFDRPLFVGESVHCSQRLASVSARSAGGFRTTFYVLEQRGVGADGTVVFTAKMTVLRREAVEA
jgi:acyl dehydratase